MALQDLHLVLASPMLCAAHFGNEIIFLFSNASGGKTLFFEEKTSSVENREEMHQCILKDGNNSRKESKRWSDLTSCKVRGASVDVFVQIVS